MRYAEVAVDAPVGYDRTLSYSIPATLELEPGQMVWVPLGQRPVQGVVFELADSPQVEATRDVLAAVDPSPLVSSTGLQLARWMSRYYMSPLFNAVALMLPFGFESRVRPYLRLGAGEGETHGVSDPMEARALDLLAGRGEVRDLEMMKALGKGGERGLRALLRKGMVQRRWEMLRPRASHKYDCYVRPAGPVGQPKTDTPSTDRAVKQAALYRALGLSEAPVPLGLANKEYGSATVAGLLDRGLVALEWVRVEREPLLQQESDDPTDRPRTLTTHQEHALAEINAAQERPAASKAPLLLHGVTGSGKTEVYLRALESCVKAGRRGIFLVPEISLTPQTVHRLNARFPGRVAVMHSRLTPGEQFDQWWRIRDGDYDVVVGPRSALFTPMPDLGLIVMDEEHEWTYKQQESLPHYHTRHVAVRIAQLSGAVMVMGSATPDVETYYKAKSGEYSLLELPQRITPSATPGLAQVEVCDMRRELREGNRSIFSRALAQALGQCTDKGEQAILFLNRRGSSTVVQCRDCGHALRCRRCSVTLTYHGAEGRLLCHHCNRRSILPKACPGCRSPRIKYLGLGTQRVMDELRRLLPTVTTLRWDKDTAQAAQAHAKIMERFLRGEAQVLIGTQMVAKGLHVPNVTLVGAVLADIGLNMPDFHAGERAFQLLCQVAGRAGRGESPGRVIIQTYSPTHYAVEAAANQDYGLLYSREIQFRRQQGNPPFSRLVHLVYLHNVAEACQREAERMGHALRQRAASLGLTDVEVVGPAPSMPERVRGKYRWHVILRGQNLHSFMEDVSVPQGWTVDVDPVTVA